MNIPLESTEMKTQYRVRAAAHRSLWSGKEEAATQRERGADTDVAAASSVLLSHPSAKFTACAAV